MKSRTSFIVLFLVVLAGLSAGYVVWEAYAVPSTMANPPAPRDRDFSVVISRIGGEVSDSLVRWTPGTLVANVGDKIVLSVTNADPEGAHGFLLPEAGVSIPQIMPGATETVEFVAKRPGIYSFSCNKTGCSADHADQTGQLVVLGQGEVL